VTLVQLSEYPCPTQAVRPNVGKRNETGFCEFTKPGFGQDFAIWAALKQLLMNPPKAVRFGNIARPYFVPRKWFPYKIPLLTILSKAKNNRICSYRIKIMIGETVKKGGYDHRQAKRQPANQDRTYPDFPRQDDPGGICVLRTWMLFAGR